MFDFLCIRHLEVSLDVTPDEVVVEWGLFRGDGTLAETPNRTTLKVLAEGIPSDASYKTIILVPGEQVLLTGADVPARQARQIARALPFVIEEQVAENIEDLHLAIGSKLDSGEIMVAAVKHRMMEKWLEQLKSVDIEPDFFIPDSLLLPAQKEGINIFIDGDRALISIAVNEAMAVDRENLGQVLDLILTEKKELKRVDFFLDADNLDQHGMELSTIEAELAEHEGLEIKIVDITETSFEYFGRLAVLSKKDVNLLQGEYKIQHEGGGLWRRWKPVMIAAAVCLSLQVCFDIGKGFYFQSKADEIVVQSETLYRELFPKDKKIVNLKGQVKNHLRSIGSSNTDAGFLKLLGDSASQLKSLGKKQTIEIQQLRFDKKKQELMMEIDAQSIAQIDQYEGLLTKLGLSVKILSANEKNGLIRGRLQISG